MERTLVKQISGADLRSLRHTRGLTAMELARRAGVSEDAVRKIESGRSKQPSFITGVRIAEALGVEPAQLAFGKSGGKTTDLLARVIRTLREKRSELARYGVQHSAVFGSVARGEATQESDIDILVDTDPDRPFSYITLSQVGLMLQDLLGRSVDIVTRLSVVESHRNILEEAIHAF